MKIGTLAVDPPVVLAPMAGVTNPAFRQLCREFGPAIFVSEMITARAVIERNDKTMRMVAPGPGEKPHSVQLYGVDPAVMDAAVRFLVGEVGVDHIDLNFGCPAPKVTRKGGGAALPAHPVLYRRVVGAATRAADREGGVPVTVKMRMGLDDATETAVEAGVIAEEEGAAAVTLHARTAEQRYSGTARWEAIGRLKEAVGSIPVLGNGDIWEAADAIEMQRRTGCDGVVIGRGCLGRPWLFADLEAAYRAAGPGGGRAERPPSWHPDLGRVAAVMLRHARLLVAYHGGPGGVRDFRKHTGWYLTGFPVGSAVRRDLNQVASLAELEDRLAGLDPALTRTEESARLPRGHTDGPRPVALPHRWLENRDDPAPPAGAEVVVSGG
ncbi:MAG TPA: tRNA dihydrouridine synthase DusB [Acidimicrobiales bacterium]|nr:tRNA dihydrouridine synthase DusB [Acidimicrobiales bacterium]